jgi:hypothetical protein
MTAARRGGARRGLAEAGKRRAGCRSGTWREERRRGAAGAQHMAGEGSGVEQRENRERGTGGRRRRTHLQFVKSVGTLL